MIYLILISFRIKKKLFKIYSILENLYYIFLIYFILYYVYNYVIII